MNFQRNFRVVVVAACIFFISATIVWAAITAISGKALVLNTGNSYFDFTHYNSNVTMDDTTGDLAGYVFSEDLGWIAVGTTDNPSGPVTVDLTTGEVSGSATVMNTSNVIDFDASSSNVEFDSTSNEFSGYVFTEDLGWIDFADTGVILGAAPPENVGSPATVSTFNSISITWTPPSASSSYAATVEFREAGTTTWLDGHPLWYSAEDDQYRGSLVHLKSGTEYEIQLRLEGFTEQALINAETWDEDFPIAQTIHLPLTSDETLTIDESGTADGYILYTHAPGVTATIDVENAERNNIVIDASYIIIRGLTLKGAQKDAIHIYPTDSHHIVIEDNDISDWGSIKYVDSGFGQDNEAAIRANTSPNVTGVVIQRNTIHHPRPDTNSWGETRADVTPTSAGTHPVGPQAVYMYQSGGNHVVRYNTIYSDNEHRFNDCIGGGSNSSEQGFPHKDSDIYGNYLSHCWDNAIEAEGGNINVRVWGNYIDETYRPIANRDTILGPLYVWRNISNKSRKYPEELYTWAQDPHGSLGKTGGESAPEAGVYYFHNTTLQPSVPGESVTGGVASGVDGPMHDTTTRNNIFHTYCTTSGCDAIKLSGGATTNDFDYDLFNKPVSITGAETHGINGTPIYTPLYGYNTITHQGNFELASNSPGYDDGIEIPNFNSHLIEGTAPDMGAHEAGMPAMQFGVAAYTLTEDPYTISSADEEPEPSPSPSPSSSPSSSSTPSTSHSSSGGSVSAPEQCSALVPQGTPDLFQIDRLGKTATLYFSPVGGAVNKYLVSYGDNTNTEQYGTSFTQDPTSGVVKFVINDLNPAQKYTFKVSAGYFCAVGPWSNTLAVGGVRNNGVRVSFYRYKLSSPFQTVKNISTNTVQRVQNSLSSSDENSEAGDASGFDGTDSNQVNEDVGTTTAQKATQTTSQSGNLESDSGMLAKLPRLSWWQWLLAWIAFAVVAVSTFLFFMKRRT